MFDRLVDRYQRLVRVTAWNVFRQTRDLDDICQEVFLKAYLNLSSLADPARFKGWLLKIAVRTCLDIKRQGFQTAETPVDFQEDWDSADQKASDEFSAPEVKSLLETLPAEDGLIIWLKYVQGHAYEEIAGMVGASEAAVRQRASRAMKVLRERLQP
ncbi:MAG: RNA polymerase sigma factor RpoE [Candidatus Ozemobacter sibiricus]|jgi:RNA polymerase sigma-70 factor (ECF subfamily)|uniref:RNA polymerase sigma factor RpoE n=1 Tax=Candidatus Ozemobacter sibiricus TaxID=2268124 RepID=A0A367ZSM3_9BACT|nr:MAG: RNA polymerase sigma factor RpoE [Candidatus Ozemobacter sibiricus]